MPDGYPAAVRDIIVAMVSADPASRPSISDARGRLAAVALEVRTPPSPPTEGAGLKERYWAERLPRLASSPALRHPPSETAWLAEVVEACLAIVQGGDVALEDPVAALSVIGAAFNERTMRSYMGVYHDAWSACVAPSVKLLEACSTSVTGGDTTAELSAAVALVLNELASSGSDGEWCPGVGPPCIRCTCMGPLCHMR